MNKHFHNLLLGVSVLPALLVMPAVATDVSNATDFANALTSGDTIKVSENISDINVVITSSGKTNNLDLNGKTISGAESATSGFIFANNSSLTMTGGGTISGFSNPDQTNQKVGGDEYGALHIGTGSNLSIVGGDWVFSGNTSGLGAINSTNGSVNANVSTIKFKDNISNAQGGGFRHDVSNAAYNDTIARITADQIIFDNNSFAEGSVVGSGAGVMNSRGRVELLGNTNTFTNNDMNATIASGRQYKVGGGAVANQSGENGGTKFDAVMVIGKADGKSVNNFSNNSSSTSGGAIMNRAVDTDGNAYLTINGTTTFSENTATLNGGAIYNVKRDNEAPGHIADIDMTNGTYTFSKNTAGGNGGAIYNEGTVQLTNAEFSNNSADVNGGAIFNFGLYDTEHETGSYAKIINTAFDSNSTADRGGAIYNYGYMTIDGTQFTSNKTTGETWESQGGAIYNAGDDDYTDEYYGILTISNSSFGSATDNTKGNIAVFGGAIANNSDCDHAGQLTLNNTNFYYNKATGATGGTSALGGAIYNYGDITVNGNTMFKGNAVTGYSPEGGAIYNTETLTFNDAVIFDSNIATDVDSDNGAFGGALSNSYSGEVVFKKLATFTGNQAISTAEKGTQGGAVYNANTMTFQKNSVFTNNEAVYGGAIFNDDATLTLAEASSFQSNHAGDEGGALFNLWGTVGLTDATFRNNTAASDGGAIANYGGTITLKGANTFTGNTANSEANDIYNMGGIVNIESGTTIMDGGITGTGTLSIADGATLNIGTASITQGTIYLEGNMFATLRDGEAQITAETFEGEGTLNLTMAKAGIYHVFGDAAFENLAWNDKGLPFDDLNENALYKLDWSNDGKDVTATTKTAEEISSETGLTGDTLVAVSHVAASASNSDSAQLQTLSVKLQEKLALGDTATVEHATKAIHPETESVAQSVSTSVQNTVVNLASARMTAPTVGRNGGDVKLTSGGIWVQGLFNKSKQADLFNGYTRGIAAGLDGTINKHWTIGAGYSFAHSDISGTARDTKIDSNTVFLYGQYKPAQWYVNAVANYTSSEYSEKGTVIENIPIFADYNVKSFGGHVATGYDFKNGITPELGLRYMHVTADDYLNSYGIKTHMDDTNFLTGIFGAKYSFDVVASKHTIFAPQLNAGIKYDLLSDKNVATITMPGLDSYTLDGNRLNRLGGEFGAGLGMKYYNLDISVNYDIDVRQDYTSQTGMLKFRCNF